MPDNLGVMSDPEAALRRALYKLPVTYGGVDGNALAMIERVQDEFAQRILALNDAQAEVERMRLALSKIKDAYRKMGEASNSDIRGIARAHLFTVLNELLGSHDPR